jgi:hypothetical protein
MLFGIGQSRKVEYGLTPQRIDNSTGHSKENCVLACHQCNNLSQRIPHAVMLERGADFHDRIISWCSMSTHVGDRIIPMDQKAETGYCKNCSRPYKAERQRKQRKRKRELCNVAKFIGEQNQTAEIASCDMRLLPENADAIIQNSSELPQSTSDA